MDHSLRILHFSDIHIGIEIRHMLWKKWFSKRAIGAINLLRGRAKYFDEAEQKLQALIRFKDEHEIDLVIHTGDYTALGLESELKLSKTMVEPLMKNPERYITVPGNHDIYVSESKSHQRFSQQFAEVLYSDMPEYCSDGCWPLVRLLGTDAAIIALNSARPNPMPWRSNGHISHTQLETLEQLLQDQHLKNRFIFIATHYAPRLANGENDTPLHGLINADDFLRVCKKVNAGAILCGHVHQTYRTDTQGFQGSIFCAGSATMDGHEGFWVYELRGKKMQAMRVYWDNLSYRFVSDNRADNDCR
ncbi:MAG: metallophosphoesterase [Methyloprofundus sp.]|nr:metallophosphoesterase [Methyloprofundus sp.]